MTKITLVTGPRRYLAKVVKVRDGFREGSDACLVKTYFFRPLSFLVTPAFVRMGMSPNMVTVLGGILAILSLVFFALGGFLFWTIGIGLFSIYFLLDMVDGNVARITNGASYLGKFMDGAFDTLAYSLLPVSIGWGQYTETEEVVWFAVGTVGGMVMLFSMYTMTRLSFHREWLRTDFLQGRLSSSASPDFDGTSSGPYLSISPLYNYIFIGLIIGAVLDIREYFVVGYAGFSVVWGATVLWSQNAAARKLLNVRRRSRHAVEEKSKN